MLIGKSNGKPKFLLRFPVPSISWHIRIMLVHSWLISDQYLIFTFVIFYWSCFKISIKLIQNHKDIVFMSNGKSRWTNQITNKLIGSLLCWTIMECHLTTQAMDSEYTRSPEKWIDIKGRKLTQICSSNLTRMKLASQWKSLLRWFRKVPHFILVE